MKNLTKVTSAAILSLGLSGDSSACDLPGCLHKQPQPQYGYAAPCPPQMGIGYVMQPQTIMVPVQQMVPVTTYQPRIVMQPQTRMVPVPVQVPMGQQQLGYGFGVQPEREERKHKACDLLHKLFNRKNDESFLNMNIAPMEQMPMQGFYQAQQPCQPCMPATQGQLPLSTYQYLQGREPNVCNPAIPGACDPTAGYQGFYNRGDQGLMQSMENRVIPTPEQPRPENPPIPRQEIDEAPLGPIQPQQNPTLMPPEAPEKEQFRPTNKFEKLDTKGWIYCSTKTKS